MFFPRRSNLRNFLHYSAWPTGPERNNPKQNGAGLSRSGVRAGIFPQKIQEERSCASSFSAQTHSAPAEFCSGHSQKYRAQRKPMLLLEFAGELFKFRAKTPALEVLFQLPPRWKARTLYRHYPSPCAKLFEQGG